MATEVLDASIVTLEKELAVQPQWFERAPHCLDLVVPLETKGVVIEGLTFRGRTGRSLPDRDITFQLEFHHPHIVGGPICRIDWRPFGAHNNKGIGPKEFRHMLQKGSHHHRFDLNWARSPEKVCRGEIPIAVPIIDDPENFRALLALVGKEFNIKGIQTITVPPWAPTML
jgi:hypothetical protein